ncbi:MAG: hypothetical protein A3H96_14740 [Acidobacteria bacterium RIFCSPLOWO2_02_FULL_67_36]|nr:MAG: hypothetical protein A3H96_14740 [Acidobacteria bacterium RIFCSPLOWO2_02_FULL_67_36]OFW18478.1 MAG: hypothetical protein A3G21_08250 [Acidobacteria bacterium RIFCSPLOWO2_12_FULL_66_21]
MRRAAFVACTLAAALAAAVASWARGQEQRPVFRSRASVVLVDVLVRDGNRVVQGLTKEDFQVFDAGVPQRIDELLGEQLPVDLTILLDASGSTARAIDRFETSAAEIAAMLRPDDRVRITAFATGIADVVPLTSSHPVFAIAPLGATTSLHDALLLTLARRQHPGRRHLVVAYTDGEDTSSVLDRPAVNAVARRSESVLHLVLSAGAGQTAPRPEHIRILRQAAEATGGGVSTRFRDAVDTLKQVFADFRESHVLRYTPTDVKAGGWHEITVRLRRADAQRFTLRARKGYAGGPE